jgi:RNA polymerase sigma-70 factor, ECF subfamily
LEHQQLTQDDVTLLALEICWSRWGPAVSPMAKVQEAFIMMDRELDFQEIYSTFQPRILGYLSRMFGAEEAEELTQEVFVKVDKALQEFRGEAQLSTWIHRIATNAALDRLRNPSFRQRARECVPVDSGTERVTELQDQNVWTGETRPDVDQQLIRLEMNGCIREYIEQLPEDYRAVLALSEVEGLKNREIAEILGVSLDTVKIRLHRARARLKESLGNHCNFYLDERSELACDRKEPGDC